MNKCRVVRLVRIMYFLLVSPIFFLLVLLLSNSVFFWLCSVLFLMFKMETFYSRLENALICRWIFCWSVDYDGDMDNENFILNLLPTCLMPEPYFCFGVL